MSARPLLISLVFVGACSAPEAEPIVATTHRGALGTYSEVTAFGANPGGLKMWKYVPSPAPAADAPLVLAMHACSQTAAAYQDAGWNELADRWGFYVLYPEQQPGNNALRCFNWAGEYGVPTNLERGQGENQSIIEMVDRMKADHAIDASRVFVMGHSGGGAQTALMLATFPDVFAGGATIAGIAYNCTTTFTQVSTCLSPGINRTAAEWGDRVRAAFSTYSGPYPKLSIWHGTADTTVATMNATELLEQWTNVQGIDMTADATDSIDGHTRTRYQDAAGNALVERWELQGMGHGTPVKPASTCGRAGAYFLDAGICAVERIGEFWGLDGTSLPGDVVAPTVNVTAPGTGTSVSGTVMVQATAADNVGVTRVEIAINGAIRATVNAAPYGYSWNTTTEANGMYRLRAVAYDAAGNSTTDDDTTVTVTGGVNDTTPPTVSISSPLEGATVGGQVQIVVDASDNFGVARVELSVDSVRVGELTAPPYTFTWNAGSVTEGTHGLSVLAVDSAGNQATATRSLNVERLAGGFSETFSTGGGADMPGWTFGDWRLDAADHTGSSGSKSLLGQVASVNNTVSSVASVSMLVQAPATYLSYQRRLVLRGGSANAKSSFEVKVNGTVVDEANVMGINTMADGSWAGRTNLDLSAFAGQAVTLELVLTAEDPDSVLTDARAYLDDFLLAEMGVAPADTVPPVVTFTNPRAGTTVRGLITVKVDATDDVGMSQVLLFLGDDLIGADYIAPYEFLWDSNVFPEGPSTLTARAFDRAGNLGPASVDITVAHQAAEEEEEEPAGDPIMAGRKTWGCTSIPGDSAFGIEIAIYAGLALAITRRRR